jgi:alcohol dehydrogenase, propanol-preferring
LHRISIYYGDRIEEDFTHEQDRNFDDNRSPLKFGGQNMRAMMLESPGSRLQEVDVPIPVPNAEQVLIQVHTCGVCRTDLHIVDGELTQPKLPLIPGHQIVGTVADYGTNVRDVFPLGTRVGVPWLGHTCNCCRYCQSGRENLCDRAQFTGYDLDGGYAEYAVADARFCFPIPAGYPDLQAAPLLCAGPIGYRSLMMTGDARSIGLYGFGADGIALSHLGQSINE